MFIISLLKSAAFSLQKQPQPPQNKFKRRLRFNNYMYHGESTMVQWFALLTRNQRVGGSSPTRCVCPQTRHFTHSCLSRPRCSKWVPAGIYSLFAMCTFRQPGIAGVIMNELHVFVKRLESYLIIIKHYINRNYYYYYYVLITRGRVNCTLIFIQGIPKNLFFAHFSK